MLKENSWQQANQVKKKGKRGEAHPKESTKKFTMKYIELDPDNVFTVAAYDRNNYALGEIYQVTKAPSKEDDELDDEFVFTGVKNIVADLELTLTAEQYKVLKKLVAVMDYESIEQYVNRAVLSIMEADADHSLSGVARESAMKTFEED